MGENEKSGSLTSVIVILVAFVTILVFVQVVFPEIIGDISEKTRNIIEINPEDYEGRFK